MRVGPHRLYHADCRRVLPAVSGAAAVVTDPPYGIDYISNRGPRASPTGGPRRPIAEDREAPLDTVALMAQATRDGGAVYLCTRFDVMARWWDAMEAAGLRMKTTIVWDKGNHTMGDLTGDYGNRTEIVLFAHRGRHRLRGARLNNLVHVPRLALEPDGHPTPKPPALMQRFIESSTDEGDLVVDPFMGSCATGVACVRSGRRFIGVDQDAEWFALAVRKIKEAYYGGA